MKRLVFFVLAGCSARAVSAEQAATRCEDALYEEVMHSETCSEARIRTEVALRASPECRKVFGDAGFDPCKKVRDAGRTD